MTKPEMRRSMKQALAAVGPVAMNERSALAATRLTALPAWERARLVLCFLSMPGEIDTLPVIAAARAAGKTVAVPLIEEVRISFRILGADPAQLPRDRWGIPVPDPAWPVADLRAAGPVIVVTPGLAFDRKGNRLGRGGGYYDGFLREARAQGADPRALAVVGICLAFQVADAVPHDDRDEKVDAIVTDEELILPA